MIVEFTAKELVKKLMNLPKEVQDLPVHYDGHNDELHHSVCSIFYMNNASEMVENPDNASYILISDGGYVL